jgi:hypothetical protein
MRLFVEIAIPTAMKILCSDLRIIPKNNLAMWTHAEKNTFPQMFDYDLGRLFAEWPDDCIYIHPVKLSEWRY